jgi:hypothetical protein
MVLSIKIPLLGCAVLLWAASPSLWAASPSRWQGVEPCGTSRQHAVELEQKLTLQPGDEAS